MGFHLRTSPQGDFALRNVEAPVRTLNNHESVQELKVYNIRWTGCVQNVSRLNRSQL